MYDKHLSEKIELKNIKLLLLSQNVWQTYLKKLNDDVWETYI